MTDTFLAGAEFLDLTANVLSATSTKPIDDTSYLNVTLLFPDGNAATMKQLLLFNNFYIKDGATYKFRGIVIEATITGVFADTVMIRVADPSWRLRARVSLTAKIFTDNIITDLAAGKITDADYGVDPGIYGAGDTAVLIVPGSSASYTDELIDSVSASIGATEYGDQDELNDNTNESTEYRVDSNGADPLVAELVGSSANAKASVVSGRITLLTKVYIPSGSLIPTSYISIKAQYYNYDTTTWIDFDAGYTFQCDLFFTAWSGTLTFTAFISSNVFVENGTDEFKLRVVATGTDLPIGKYPKLAIWGVTTKIFTDSVYNGAAFPISSYAADGFNVTVNPITAGVDIGDTYCVGINDKLALNYVFAFLNGQGVEITPDIDAAFEDTYTAQIFQVKQVKDILAYFCEKCFAHWWFDHATGTVMIYKESSMSAAPTVRTVDESLITAEGFILNDKADGRVSKVYIAGATFQTPDGSDHTITYTYPDDSVDTVTIPAYGFPIDRNLPAITSITEAGLYAAALFEKANRDEPSVDFELLTAAGWIIGDYADLDIGGSTPANLPIVQVVTTWSPGELTTEKYRCGWQKTPPAERVSNKITELDKRVRDLESMAHGTLAVATGYILTTDQIIRIAAAVQNIGNETIAGVKSFSGSIKVDTINEYSVGVGVTIDSVLIKDGNITLANAGLLKASFIQPTGAGGYDDFVLFDKDATYQVLFYDDSEAIIGIGRTFAGFNVTQLPMYIDGVSGIVYTNNDLDVTGNIIVSGNVDGYDVSAHVEDATIHFLEGAISHANILDIGLNSHDQIDDHIDDADIHFELGDIALALDDLTDVTITASDENDFLVCDGYGIFVDKTPAEVRTILGFLDEDNMASNSETAFCSQQSIKKYVDDQVGGVGFPENLDDLLDVTITSSDENDFLICNDEGVFVDKTVAETLAILLSAPIESAITIDDDTTLTLGDSNNVIFEYQSGDAFLHLTILEHFTTDLGGYWQIRDDDDSDAILVRLDTSARTLAIGQGTDTIAITFTGTINLNGTELTSTFTELNFVSGVTSAIQTQIDSKGDGKGSLKMLGNFINGTGTAMVSDGNNFYILSTAADSFRGTVDADWKRTVGGATKYLRITTIEVYWYAANAAQIDLFQVTMTDLAGTSSTLVNDGTDRGTTGYNNFTYTVNTTLTSTYKQFSILIGYKNKTANADFRLAGCLVNYEYV